MRKLIIILSTFTALTSIVLAQVKHKDVPYAQEYAIKYQSDYPCDEVEFDLNGNIKLIGNGEVKKITFGELLIPGKVVDDNSYRFMKDKHIIDVIQVDSQFVYLDKNVIFSNAWAGDLFIRHNLSNPKGFIGISKLDYLVYNDNTIQCIDKGKVSWKTSVGQSQILEILFEKNSADFYVLTTEGVSKGNLKNGKIRPIYKGTDFVSIAAIKGGYVLAHRTDGLYYFNSNFNFSKKENKLPSLELPKKELYCVLVLKFPVNPSLFFVIMFIVPILLPCNDDDGLSIISIFFISLAFKLDKKIAFFPFSIFNIFPFI